MLRENKERQNSFYSVLYEKIPESHILKQIDKAVDFSFINDLLESSYCKNFGRPAKEPEMMMKLLFLQYIYNLSDVKVIEEAKVERPCGVHSDRMQWYEQEMPEKNMGGIVGKTDKNHNGIAFVSAFGLHECSAEKNTDGSVAVTLLRCFKRVFMNPGSVLSQIQGKIEYDYAFVPMNSNKDFADLVNIKNEISTGVFAYSRKTQMPETKSASLIAVDNKQIILSILKIAENQNGYIARFYNCSDTEQKANIEINAKKVYEASLNETVLNETGCNLAFRPFEIKTLYFGE